MIFFIITLFLTILLLAIWLGFTFFIFPNPHCSITLEAGITRLFFCLILFVLILDIIGIIISIIKPFLILLLLTLIATYIVRDIQS